MSKITCLVLCIVAASLAKVSAVTDKEKAAFHAALAPIIAECSEEHGVSEADITAAKEAGSADGIKPCFVGCVMKKIEILDSKGKYDAEKGLGQLKQFVQGKEDIAKYEEIGKLCSSVNDEEVSDGEAGCERAKLLLACAMKNDVEIPV